MSIDVLKEKIGNLQQNNRLVILRSCGSDYQNTLMRELTDGCNLVDLSLPNLRLQAEQNPQLFADGLRLPAFLAGLQYAPFLLPALLNSGLPLGQILASCSQSYYLEELSAQGPYGSVSFMELPMQAG
uniref:hypothetical protein n=1 Tax=uncultured Phascolarctobacterium sp. TaxID=512296 RepID=UPI0025ECBFED